MEVAAFLVSLGALGFTVVQYFRQEGLQRRVTDIEEARRREAITSRLMADVTVRTAKEHPPGTQTEWLSLVIHNRGPAAAENVDIDATAQGWTVMKEGARFPVSLDAGQEYRVPLGIVVNADATMDVTITWRDGTGERSKHMTVTYP